MRTNRVVKSGNRNVVLFDGTEIGLVQSVDANDNYNPEQASGIGDIHVAEHVPTLADHTINVSKMVLRFDQMRAAGISWLNGDDALEGRIFDISVIDKDSGQEVRRYIGCTYASGGVRTNKHAIMLTDAVFKALDVTGTGA